MSYIIVGAGPAGLSLAYSLAINSIPITIIENSDQLGGSWNSQWIDNKYFSENSPRVIVHNDNMNSLLHHIGMDDSDFTNIYGDSFATNIKMLSFLKRHFHLKDYIIFGAAFIKYRSIKVNETVQNWMDKSSLSTSGKKAITIISILLCDRPENTNVCDLFGMFGLSPVPLRQMIEPNKWHELIQYYIGYMPHVQIIKNSKVIKIIKNYKATSVDGVIVRDNKSHHQNTIYADKVVLCTQSNGIVPILENSDIDIKNNWYPFRYMKVWGENTFYCGFGFQLNFIEEVTMPSEWCWSCTGDWTVIILPISRWLKSFSNDPDIKTVWSCCIVDMDTRSTYLNKTANECTDQQEVVNECIRQINEQGNIKINPAVVTTSVGLHRINSRWISKNTGYTQSKYGNLNMKGKMQNLFALGCFTDTGTASVATMGKAIDATAHYLSYYETNLQKKVFSL